MSAELADCSDHKGLVVLPQGLKNKDRVQVVAKELRKEQGQKFVHHECATNYWSAQAQSEQEILWNLLEWGLKELSHPLEVMGIRESKQAFD